jgi:ribosomal protein L3 glutamine methyltransferase
MFADAPERLRTVRDLLRFGVSRFNEAGLAFGHGSDNALDEAAYLILNTLRLPLDRLDVFLDATLTTDEVTRVLDVLRQRIERRVPAAYLTNEAWLGDLRFYVDERVIVPRSHIAELLREGLSPWISDPVSVTSALDLCTGSGCLAIMLAHAFPNARVDAVDLSAEALQVAQRNIDDYGLGAQVRLVPGDLFQGLAGQRYPLIISNPPYVDAEAMAALPAEYLAEPRVALAAGDDGLDLVRRILAQATQHLTPDGLLVVEVGRDRPALEAAYPSLPFTWIATAAGEDFVFCLTARELTGAGF